MSDERLYRIPPRDPSRPGTGWDTVPAAHILGHTDTVPASIPDAGIGCDTSDRYLTVHLRPGRRQMQHEQTDRRPFDPK